MELNSAEYWNTIYSKGFYQDSVENDHKVTYKFLDQLIKEGSSVLEIATGSGFAVSYLAREKSCLCIGTDLSSVAIAECIKRYEKMIMDSKIAFRIMDIRKPDLGGLFFDHVLAFEVIEHLETKDLYRSLINMRKFLKPTGSLIFTIPMKGGRHDELECHTQHFDYNSIINTMFLAGFRSVKIINIPEYAGNGIFGEARQ